MNDPTERPGEASGRPRFAIGHVPMAAADVSVLATFYAAIGMRLVVDFDHMAIVELRGGTHIVIHSGPSGNGSLDLIVDDIDETRDLFIELGSVATDIVRGNPHDRFDTTDPEGNELIVRSNHAIGIV